MEDGSIIEPAEIITIVTGTGDSDAAVVAAPFLRLLGFTILESAGVAAVASVKIVHGATAAGGADVFEFNLAADGSVSEWFGPIGIKFPDGISIDRTAGETKLALFVDQTK